MARNWQHANETISTTIKGLLHSLLTQYLTLADPLVDFQHKISVTHIMRSAFGPAIFTEYWQLNGCYINPRWHGWGAGTLVLSCGFSKFNLNRCPS
jgi:hypothetical protein